MFEGLVVRAFSHICLVDIGGETLECRPRGKLRYRERRAMVGDRVRVTPAGPGLGVIEDILPRRNELARPPVANVDLAVVVFSLREPEVDLLVVDQVLLLVGRAGLGAALCLNKTDLLEPSEADKVRQVYAGLGYPFVAVSARTGEALEDLRALLSGRVSVLAGPSGVGKSSLLNALNAELRLRTGELSRKVRRGTHTTRDVSLVPTGSGGLVADTPGFTQLGLEGVSPEEVGWAYPELAELAPGCRFRGCLHRAEPGCRVKEAVAEGRVDPGRYARYLELLAEVEQTYRPW